MMVYSSPSRRICPDRSLSEMRISTNEGLLVGFLSSLSININSLMVCARLMTTTDCVQHKVSSTTGEARNNHQHIERRPCDNHSFTVASFSRDNRRNQSAAVLTLIRSG